MARNSYKKTFTTEKVGVNGCLYKAGLTADSDTLEGHGRGDDGESWFLAIGDGVAVSNGGLKAESAGSWKITPTDAAGRRSAIRAALMNRGAFQIDIYADEFCSHATETNFEWIRAYSDSGGTGAPLYLRGQNSVLGNAATYDSVVRDADDAYILDTPILCTSGSGVKGGTGVDCPPVIHRGLANADGYFTYGVDWYGNWQRTFINGTLVGEMPMASYPGELQKIEFCRTAACRASMKNLLIYDRPFPRHNKPTVRISMAGHSFIGRQQLNIKTFDNGTIGGEVGGTLIGGMEAWNSQLFQKVNAEIDIYSFGVSGSNLAETKDRIINGTPETYSVFTGNYQDHVHRFRPHFCVIMSAPFNNNGVTLNSDMHLITVDLMAAGIIPVWCIDYNNTDLDHADEAADMLTEVNRQRAANDMGLCDFFTYFGGLPDASYRASEAATNHPNYKAQPEMATLIANEINRLIADPPNYSRLAGGNGEHETIASP